MNDSKKKAAEERDKSPLTWLQLLGEARRTIHASMGGGMSSEFWQHTRAARKEHLLAIKSLIDGQITRLERQEEDAKERKASKITIQ